MKDPVAMVGYRSGLAALPVLFPGLALLSTLQLPELMSHLRGSSTELSFLCLSSLAALR